MPNLPISQLPQSDTLQGTELFVDVQGGVTKYTTTNDIKNYISGYISVYSTTTQPLLTSGSAQAVTFNNTWASKDISLVDNTKLTMAKAGTYQFNFVAQVANLNNDVSEAYFWVKYNGNNFPNSTTSMTLQPRKNADTPSGQLLTVNIVGVAQNDNDYIELYWTGDSTLLSLKERPATGVYPECPSIIADIIKVG